MKLSVARLGTMTPTGTSTGLSVFCDHNNMALVNRHSVDGYRRWGWLGLASVDGISAALRRDLVIRSTQKTKYSDTSKPGLMDDLLVVY
ncbi:hypothetical protein VUR80DRAFT_7624 [Thermomyces stellatus]